MSSPKPVPPLEVPETAATYERTNENKSLDRAQAKADPKPDVKGPATSDADRPAPLPAGGVIAGDMKTEEPQGWDQAPMDIKDPRQKRHPRPDGVGGSEPDSTKRDPIR